MKRALTYFTAVLFSTLIVLCSGQFTVGKMSCPSGKASYSLGKAKDCCDKKESVNKTFEGSCCKLVNIAYSVDDFSFSEKVKVAPAGLHFISCQSIPVFVRHSSSVIRHFINSSPPLLASSLTFLGAFLI